MKGYKSNGGARSTTVYDDVFGGPPKFGATTLPPRVEDYTEIFQGFHASRGSSIPVLDLPADSGDVWFDVRKSKFDYNEVFGGFNGLDFAVEYHELFKSSNAAADDSSDDVWTPAQSESLSDESDPYASLDMNQQVPTEDPNQLSGVISEKEAYLEAEKYVSNGMENDSQFLDVAGSTLSDNEAAPSKIENEKFFSLANNDLRTNKNLGEVAEGKQLKKSLSQPLDSVFGTEIYGSDNLVGNQKAFPVGTRPPLSVSDLGLKTQPSHLPPPSRPPPALTSKKGDTSGANSKLKTSKSYAFERVSTGDRSPPYFDVEIDASSSAAADVAAMKDAMQQAQAKLNSAKEKMERKKEGLQSRSKLRMENNVGDKKGRVNEGYGRSNSYERDSTRHVVREENQKMKMTTDVDFPVEAEKNITKAGNSFERKTVKEHTVYLGAGKTEGTVMSREATEPLESVARKQVQEPNDRSLGSRKNNMAVLESFGHKEDDIVQESVLRGLEEDDVRKEPIDRSDREEEQLKEPTVPYKTCYPREPEKRFLVGQQHGESKAPNDSDENELYENLIEIQLKDIDMKPRIQAVGFNGKVVPENRFEDGNGREDDDVGLASYDWEVSDVGLQAVVGKEHEKELKLIEEQDKKEIKKSDLPEISVIQGEEEEEEDHEIIVEDPFHWEENEKESVKASEQDENDKIWETISEEDENIQKQTLDHSEKILHEECMQGVDKIKTEEALDDEVMKNKEKLCTRDDTLQTLNNAGVNEKMEAVHEIDCSFDGNKVSEAEREESDKRDAVVSENEEGIKWDEDSDERLNSNEENESVTLANSEASDVVYQVNDNEISQAPRDVQYDIPIEKSKTTLETPHPVKSEKVEETVAQSQEVDEESFSSFELHYNDLQGVKVKVSTAKAGDTYAFNTNTKPEGRTNANTTTSPRVAKEWVEAGAKPPMDQVDSSRNTNATSKVADRSMERKDENRTKFVSENRGKEERLQRARELENERLRKIEEERERLQRARELENERLRKIEDERERQIEREKDRMAVDRATLEAREKAFAETRERAERAAVERATSEFRQRALAEARERLEKACAEARERSLAEKAMEGRLRVEKATAEARERAERSAGDKFSAYQNNTMRQNSLPSDLSDSQFQKLGSFSGLRYSQTAAQSGEGESPQRCKARLERHQRTADRAAKALAEKNTRDLVAQKEQAERNRLAEVLDAEVKRWCSGKQGNLRALLSTLQYILGSDSGWQPVPLTEVITTAAVKKAYRKATLCVHPDKLQQRGASIQQKYICEKVFDLLKLGTSSTQKSGRYGVASFKGSAEFL
ncbi:auxilin-like protein 1 [Tanacetum coccineum]